MRMPGSTRARLLTVILVVVGMPASAQDHAQEHVARRDILPSALSELATCYGARHESGAYLTAAMPRIWNRHLVVFAHGGPAVAPPSATYSLADLTKYAFAVRQGYAWVASTYRKEGYGVQMAAEDTDDARRFFVDRIARPRRTILHGASWGGLVGAKLLETRARSRDGGLNFDGALLNSGFLAGSLVGYEFRADLRVVYQHYCRNLPRPDEPQYPLWSGIAAEFQADPESPRSDRRRVHRRHKGGRCALRASETEPRQYPRGIAVSGAASRPPHAGGNVSLPGNRSAYHQRPQCILEHRRALRRLERRRGAQSRHCAIRGRSDGHSRARGPTASRPGRCRCPHFRSTRSTIRRSRWKYSPSIATGSTGRATAIGLCKPTPTRRRTPRKAHASSPRRSIRSCNGSTRAPNRRRRRLQLRARPCPIDSKGSATINPNSIRRPTAPAMPAG